MLTVKILLLGRDASLHVFLYYEGLRWASFIMPWLLDVQTVFSLCVIWFLDHESRISVTTCSNRMAFLKAFMGHRNESVSQRWDHIAEDMNEVLSTCAEDPSPYFFYDGPACRAYFNRIFSIEPQKASFMSRFEFPDNNEYPELSPYVQEVKNILESENILEMENI
ncbi:LAFE_0F11144g1_1 [Lachancea fermentati]|uniref:LAFE_0F11144g1_1 n=1 Tax=Lachancea fermentati TaxID=4955 RepID=A0A1G4MFS4_LACFM|nr:LAFE_0F11144g1_1 [Lachancea fermentati]